MGADGITQSKAKGLKIRGGGPKGIGNQELQCPRTEVDGCPRSRRDKKFILDVYS
jgi:hypothetical protein